MRQRGRKSAMNLAQIDITGTPTRLTTPAGLTKDEQSLFDFIVDASPSHHFTDSDVPLLVSFVEASLLARTFARIPTKVSIWERAVPVQAMLATKLRLSPQTRLDPKTLARQYADFDPNATPWDIQSADSAA
jgi:hypothetical protein